MPILDKIVLVSSYTNTLDLLQETVNRLGHICLRLDGKVAGDKQQMLVDEFNSK